MRSTSTSPDAGFSLAETLVALAILALVAAISLPATRRPSPASELRAFANKLANDLRRARASAIARSIPVEVVFEADTRVYRLGFKPEAETVPPSMSLAVETAREIARFGTDPVIRFFADGTSSGGSLRLTAGAAEVTLRVDWLTGAVATSELAHGRP